MKLYTIKNDHRIFVKEVFSFVGATDKVLEDGFAGTWVLEAGDKEFVYIGTVFDPWQEVHRDTLLPA